MLLRKVSFLELQVDGTSLHLYDPPVPLDVVGGGAVLLLGQQF
jgi:hypothetical protein